MDREKRAKIVRAKRDAIGLTQTELATKAGVSLSYVQKLEAGSEDRNSRPAHLRAVATVLGFDTEYLRIIPSAFPPVPPSPAPTDATSADALAWVPANLRHALDAKATAIGKLPVVWAARFREDNADLDADELVTLLRDSLRPFTGKRRGREAAMKKTGD